MVSQNGTAGHTAGRIQEFNYPVPRGSIVVMCSDGLGTHWDLAPTRGFARAIQASSPASSTVISAAGATT